MLLQINDGLTVVWASQNGGFNMVELFQDWCRILLGVHRYPKGVKPPEHINPHTAILS